MSKGKIIHLDNDSQKLAESKNYFIQCDITKDFDLITCETKTNFEKMIDQHWQSLKCLIFDLVGVDHGKAKLDENNLKFLENIEKSFKSFNIPIFIYSGHIDKLEDRFNNNGTVFKIDKENGIEVIYNKIELFHKSGFLDLFCPGGVLETEIHKDINISFTKQFRSGEIENLIKSVQENDPGKVNERCTEIFKRIAVRTLMSKLLSPIVEDKSSVNAIEHYYRRISEVDYWTGDIYTKKDNTEIIIILTPRCDVIRAETDNLIICEIEKIDYEISKTNRIKSIQNILDDNKQGKTKRWLPKSPVFEGGRVNFSKCRSISRDKLNNDYLRTITLSDDLTNELLGKFSYYFLRTGISTINPAEFDAYIKILNKADDEKE